jgi:hypothetical protein
LSDNFVAPQDQRMQWVTAKWITQPIQVVSELGVPDLLCAGPQRAEDLAEKTQTHAPTLFRVMRALSSVGVFVQTGDGKFALTPLSECLLSDYPAMTGVVAELPIAVASAGKNLSSKGLHDRDDVRLSRRRNPGRVIGCIERGRFTGGKGRK